MRYLIVITRDGDGWGAYAPDLPGCAATADARDEVIARMREAIAQRLESLREQSAPIPAPTSAPAYIDVTLPSTLV